MHNSLQEKKCISKTLKIMDCDGCKGRKWSFGTVSQRLEKLVSLRHIAVVHKTKAVAEVFVTVPNGTRGRAFIQF